MINKPISTIALLLTFALGCNNKENTIRIAVTTDVHGMIFPYDFVNRNPSDHSLSHVYSYVTEQRGLEDTLFFLLDNGDFLQGQPTVYYYNFVDTSVSHLSASVMNYLGYDAGTVGNHDIETGPDVYNKIRKEFRFPWLGANAVNQETGEPYFEPYTILTAGTIKIAVLGLITPAIPEWLPKNLWPDMEFRDMVETAGNWIPKILQSEEPDLVIGLFHSGTDSGFGSNKGNYLNENAALQVAEQVPGFDVVFAGHDHQVAIKYVINTSGDSVLVVDPGSHARYAGEVTISFDKNGQKQISAVNIPMSEYTPSEIFLDRYKSELDEVKRYLEDTITWLTRDMTGLAALSGPSSMMSLIHTVQLELSGADLSFTAPLSLSANLERGAVLVSDMFKLYRFENMLYSMTLSGKEVDLFLEYSAGIWFNTMSGPADHLLLFSDESPGRLAYPYYNFSSAAGIDYTVDVRRPEGDRVMIHGFSDGSDFSENEYYQVAVNSYRGNGGGGHLTKGCGISAKELAGRVTWSTGKDLRFYLMEYLARKTIYTPSELTNWQCIPEEWVETAAKKDLISLQ